MTLFNVGDQFITPLQPNYVYEVVTVLYDHPRNGERSYDVKIISSPDNRNLGLKFQNLYDDTTWQLTHKAQEPEKPKRNRFEDL